MDQREQIAELMSKPVMPETYDLQEPMGLPYARAFGAGVVDPWGMTGRGLKALGFEHPARKLYEWRAESPMAAGAGSGLTTGLTMGRLGGARLGEMMDPSLLGPLMGAGMYSGDILDDFGLMPRQAPRAQGSYPTGGAY